MQTPTLRSSEPEVDEVEEVEPARFRVMSSV
jgi:hypothetical protein